jgi:SAM-dependent methyltransferase
MSKDKYTMRRYRIAKEMLNAGSKDRVLDIGCYDGYFLSILGSSDNYGVDTDAEALELAKAKGIKILDSVNYPEYFDIVICMEVLEHIQDPEEMVKSIRYLIKPEGKVLISLPNECNIWARIRMLLGWGINDIPFTSYYHKHFPTIKQSEQFISKHFKIVKKRYWVYGLPQWLSILPGLFARGVIFECHRLT